MLNRNFLAQSDVFSFHIRSYGKNVHPLDGISSMCMMDDMFRFQARRSTPNDIPHEVLRGKVVYFRLHGIIKLTGFKRPLRPADSHGVGFVSAAFPAAFPLSTAGDVAGLFFGILYPGGLPFFDWESETFVNHNGS